MLLQVRNVGEHFKKLSKLKKMFTQSPNNEIENQEVDKTRRFNKTQLNINSDRFSGYDSQSDFYSFRSNFEKLHAQSTPKRLLPDLLKNNYLSEPALTLVKSIENIDIIWERLKEAYGDAKIILSQKLKKLKFGRYSNVKSRETNDRTG